MSNPVGLLMTNLQIALNELQQHYTACLDSDHVLTATLVSGKDRVPMVLTQGAEGLMWCAAGAADLDKLRTVGPETAYEYARKVNGTVREPWAPALYHVTAMPKRAFLDDNMAEIEKAFAALKTSASFTVILA